MQIKEVIKALEAFAPPAYQESYDNSGFIVGNETTDLKGILICLDSTEEVIDEAIEKGCNLVVAHHPILFSGIKKITGKNYVERVLIKAIKNDIAIYAVHTNLDNVREGVNKRICDKLGLKNTRILAPKKGLLRKLFTFAPTAHAPAVRQAIFSAGGGNIGDYDECSFNLTGQGTFRGQEGSDPFVGEKGKQHQEEEVKIEVIYPAFKEKQIIEAMISAHPYEEVAYDIIALENNFNNIGSGMIGEVEKPVEEMEFLKMVRKAFNAGTVRYTSLRGMPIKKVAVCGGSGSFLLPNAVNAGADIFITADLKYHQFFDAEGKIVIADIGHYESEQFTIDLLGDILSKKFSNFAVLLTKVNTNPIKYI